MYGQDIFISFLLALLSITASPQDNSVYLNENEIYKWWYLGNNSTANFTIYTSTHTEKLSVYATDLRSANADGHGAGLSTYDYIQNTNFSFVETDAPSIGEGYLSIVATFSQPIHLFDGEPIHIVLNSNDTIKFKFLTFPNSKIVTISLTPFQGKPIAYISNSSIPNADDESTYQHTISSHINIVENNTNMTNTYYILANNAINSDESRFYVTASTYYTNIMLQSGVPRQDDVDYGSNRYYYFNVTELNCTLGILLTVIQGDPDLFVSSTNHYPNSTDYDVRAQNFGSDYIIINDASINMYYIAVQPTFHRNAKYTISTILRCPHNKHFTYLIDGMSQMNVLSSKEWAQYKFEFNFNSSISEILIQINPSHGDPDLYIDIDINNTSDPESWRYKSKQYGFDHIRLLSKDYFEICSKDTSDAFCTLNIAVLGYSATIYTIMVSSSESHTLLQNGKPNTGYVSTNIPYTYYMFDLDDNRALLQSNNITISITPLVSTSDMINIIFYIDGDSNPMPNVDNGYKYISIDNAHPFKLIDGNDIITDNWRELYIGVTSDQNITFTIVVTIGTEIQLQDGQSQLGHVSFNHAMYYELIIDENDKHNQQVEIIATSMHGHINVFVSVNGMIPNPSNSSTYDFCNTQQGMSVKRILIYHTKYNDTECINHLCRLYITISTHDFVEDAEYTLIASTDTAVISLFDGQPISSQINVHQYEYFSIAIDYSYKSEPVLFIESTPIVGDVNLYVSDDDNNHRPNMSHYSFKSEKGGADTDSIIINVAKEQVYYIAVYCVDQISTFSITATLSNTLHPGFVRLLSGIPQHGHTTGATSGRFYQIYVPSQATLLKLHVRHRMFPIKVYITNNITNNKLPSAHNKLYKLKSGTLTIQNPVEGSYYVGIYSHILSSYTITATLSSDILLLQDGQSISGNINAHKYDYYQMKIHDLTKDFTVTLTSFSGDPDLYISLQKENDASFRPTAHDYTFSSHHYGSDLITISHDDPLSCNSTTVDCTYIIGIYGYRHSLYSITATTEQIIELQDGISVEGDIKSDQWHFYKFQVANLPVMIVVGVTLISGQIDLFINLNKEPTSTSYLYSAYSWDQDKNIQISHTSCESDDEFCVYFIGIKGVTDCQYSVFFQSNTGNEFLIQDSVPVTRTINAQQFIFFKYFVAENLKDVTISLTPITGHPQCFISSLIERPTKDNYEYKMSDGIANSTNIKNVKNNTIYHITMFSATESTFSLSVIGEHYNRSNDATGIKLIEGNILFGSTDSWAYYSFSPSMSTNYDIIISVYALSGDPDIFCNLNSFPTLNRYLYSADLDGPETLTIPHRNDTYFCGIHADNNVTTEFYLIAYHSHTIVNLIDDIPVIGELNAKNDVNYYHFFAESLDIDDGGVISLIFTPIYSSQCFIFLSYNTYHPNETFHEYAVNNSADNGLNGIDFKISKKELLISRDWYITIQAVINSPSKIMRSSALYTLLLTYDNVTTLQEGLPQNGQIDVHQVSYYIWNIDLSDKEKDKPLFVSLSLLSGDCKIYISRNPSILNSCKNGIGCPLNLFDFSHSCSNKSPLIINKDDAYYISVGTYYISVCNTQIDSQISTNTYYNINAYTSYTILYLANAFPTWDAIQLNQYKYYSLLCNQYDNIRSLDIVITPNIQHDLPFPFIIKGIISTTRSRPQQDVIKNDEFETEWIDDNGAVFSISKDHKDFIAASQYFISLYSIINPDNNNNQQLPVSMVYTISAVISIDNSIEYRVLINNKEQMSIIHDSNYGRYYSFKSNGSHSITFSLLVAQGQISMYIIDNDSSNNKNNAPSSENYQYKLDNIDKEKYLQISNPCDCSYLIVIYAESESIYSIRADINIPPPNPHSNKSNYTAIYVIGVIVFIIILVLSIVGFVNYKKNKNLNYELDIAELQLNMDGKKTLRQRREELQSTTNQPAKAWNNVKKMKNKNKKKYSGIDTNVNEDTNVLLSVQDDSDLDLSDNKIQ